MVSQAPAPLNGMSNAATNDIAWKQISEGRYERAISGPEKFLKCAADPGEGYGTTSETITTIVDYHTEQASIVDFFRQAWLHMHNDFPQMAASLIGSKRIYDVKTVQTKALETFVIVQDKTVEETHANVGIVQNVWLYVLPQAQRLMLAVSHVMSDGRGSLFFLDEFFNRVAAIAKGQLAASVAWNTDNMLARLAPSLNEITKPAPTEEGVKRAQQALGEMGQYSEGLDIHAADQPPGTPRWQGVQFSENESAAIFQSTKKRGATVASVAHAAIATATNKMAGKTKPNNGIISTDVRQYCGQYAKEPLTMYLALPLRTVVDTSNFDTTVDAMVANYKTLREGFKSGEFAVMDEEVWKLFKEMDPPPEIPDRTIVDFSNLGIVDNFVKQSYGDLSILEVRQQCVRVTSRLLLFLLTFRGKLRGSMTYNDRYYSTSEIQQFVKLFKSELMGGLGVPQEIDALEVMA